MNICFCVDKMSGINPEVHSEPSQTSNMEPFEKMDDGLSPQQEAPSWIFDWVLYTAL